MKSIKNIVFAGILALGAFLTLTNTSCTKDSSTSASQYVKNWAASDTVNSNHWSYTCNITAGTTTTTLVIDTNFANHFFLHPISATFSGNNIVIPAQIPDNDGYQVAGSGVFANNKIRWTYVITDTSTSTSNSVVGTWQ